MQYTSCSLKNLITDILQVQPTKRPTIQQIIQSDWLLGQIFSLSYPSSNQMVPKLTKSGSITRSGPFLDDEVFYPQAEVINYMQKTLGVPSVDLGKANNFSQHSKHCTLGIFRILMHRLQNGKSLEKSKRKRFRLANNGFDECDRDSLSDPGESSSDGAGQNDMKGENFWSTQSEKPPQLRQKMNKSSACAVL